MPVELLAPAQNFKSLKVVAGHADAIYFGVELLNMRMRAENFRLEEIAQVSSFCHEHNMKAYLATNVILYNQELAEAADLIQKAHDAGVDAIIVQDVAAIQLCKDAGIPFHISTQVSISNIKAAEYYEGLGAERLILARELSLTQIAEIKKGLARAKVECFVHGAQCTSISGRCYFSADVCGTSENSANRGKCIQPCRRRWTLTDEEGNEFDYDGFYFLNAKDLCMIEHVPKLVATGIDAFKIEGRMRRPDYIETVTRCYREAIDAFHDGTYTTEKVETWLSQLKRVYNRGFSTGFYFGRPTEKDVMNARGNVSPVCRQEIGVVVTYFRESHVAEVLVTQGQLKIGDEICFEGINTDTYFKQVVHSIQIKRQAISETPIIKGQDQKIAVGVQVDQPVKKNDMVYKFSTREDNSPAKIDDNG